MDPIEFVSGIPFKVKPDTEDKAKVVQALCTFYCRFLSEDPIDGTSFDCQVLDALALIREYPELWELRREKRLQRDRDSSSGSGLNRPVGG